MSITCDASQSVDKYWRWEKTSIPEVNLVIVVAVVLSWLDRQQVSANTLLPSRITVKVKVV